MTKKGIKTLPKLDRPREKLERYGVGRLEDHELMSLVLGSGVKGTDVTQLSKKILDLIESKGVEGLSADELMSIHGLGNAKSSLVLAVLELGKRLYSNRPQIVVTPEKAFELCGDIRDSKREHFVAFYLNSRNCLISREVISIGTLDASIVDPRSVFEPTLRLGAASVMLAHNHPSGDIEPSDEDILITARLKEAGRLIGIKLVDHIIVTKSEYRSTF